MKKFKVRNVAIVTWLVMSILSFIAGYDIAMWSSLVITNVYIATWTSK